MPKRPKGRRSVHSKLRDARTQLAETNAQLSSAISGLRRYEEVLAAVRSENDEAIEFARVAIEDALGDRNFYSDVADQLTRELDAARTQIRQIRAFATVMAVKGVGDLAPAEAVATLSDGAAYCDIDADDVLAAANTVLPEAYRLNAKVNLELATAPALPEIFDVLRELGVHSAQV